MAELVALAVAWTATTAARFVLLARDTHPGGANRVTATATIERADDAGGPPAVSDARDASWFLRNWAELLTASGALALFAWALDRNGYANTFYSAAVRSMTVNWHNFFYGSLDPGGWITVDKPPAALWLQALSVRIFGFSSWSLLLPSAVCGALAVWFLMLTVRRAWGRTAGIVAGVALALTPAIVAVSRSNNPDATLVLAVVLAAWAVQKGIADGRVRWMVLAGVCCGFGFLTKLLAAGIVMPGLWGAYLVAAPGPWRKRTLHCLAGAAAFFVVAIGWVALVDLRPLADRPWIGGSTDGSALDLVFGYDGFGRITGATAGPGGNAFGGGPGGVFGGGGGINQFGGATGLLRLFNNGMGDQVMWLFPVALVSAFAGMITAARRRVRDARLGSLIMWVGWAVVVYFVFAFAKGVYHNYYVSLLAPALAALVGIGVAQVREAKMAGRVVAALAVGATAWLQLVFLDRVDAWTWLRVAVPVGAVLGVAVVAVLLWRQPKSRAVVWGSPRRDRGRRARGTRGVVARRRAARAERHIPRCPADVFGPDRAGRWVPGWWWVPGAGVRWCGRPGRGRGRRIRWGRRVRRWCTGRWCTGWRWIRWRRPVDGGAAMVAVAGPRASGGSSRWTVRCRRRAQSSTAIRSSRWAGSAGVTRPGLRPASPIWWSRASCASSPRAAGSAGSAAPVAGRGWRTRYRLRARRWTRPGGAAPARAVFTTARARPRCSGPPGPEPPSCPDHAELRGRVRSVRSTRTTRRNGPLPCSDPLPTGG